MPESFHIEEITSPGMATVLRVSGHLNATSTPDLLKQARVVKERGENLIINLSAISFIASSGVGVLLALGEEFRECGQDICYAELSQVVGSVIKLLNLDAFLAIVESEEQALRRAA